MGELLVYRRVDLIFHQEFQVHGPFTNHLLNSWDILVPKMKGFLNSYFRLFWGWVCPYTSRIHTAYIGEDSSISGT